MPFNLQNTIFELELLTIKNYFMKRLFIIALVMLFAFSLSAQDFDLAPQTSKIFKEGKINKLNTPAKDSKAVILSEDFSDG